jgi:hypothetical protein
MFHHIGRFAAFAICAAPTIAQPGPAMDTGRSSARFAGARRLDWSATVVLVNAAAVRSSTSRRVLARRDPRPDQQLAVAVLVAFTS